MSVARLRFGLLASLLVLTAVAAGAAAGPSRVHLPRDHFAHPSAGIEWWYVTALVHDAGGRRYNVFFTLFRRGSFVLPISQVVDLERDRVVGHSEQAAPATVGTTKLDVAAGGAHLAYATETSTWSFAAAAPGYALSFTAKPEKRYVLHGGGTGLIGQSLGGRSAYYSDTRMAAQGTVTTGGRRLAFDGEAWFDHQWGSFESDPRAFNWDWFSCRFDDRTELMLYRFRDRVTGKPLAAYRNGTLVRQDGTSEQITDFTATSDGLRWPQTWRLRVPKLGLDIHLRSLARNQLFHGAVVPTFWEGASAVTGSKRGVCFVEVTYR